jgi:hypothetical protein
MKALAKSPAERYGTMAEFVEDLQRFRRGESTSVMATTYRARIQRWVKSNLPLKKTTLLLSLGLLVGYLLRGVAHGAPLP